MLVETPVVGSTMLRDVKLPVASVPLSDSLKPSVKMSESENEPAAGPELGDSESFSVSLSVSESLTRLVPLDVSPNMLVSQPLVTGFHLVVVNVELPFKRSAIADSE